MGRSAVVIKLFQQPLVIFIFMEFGMQIKFMVTCINNNDDGI